MTTATFRTTRTVIEAWIGQIHDAAYDAIRVARALGEPVLLRFNEVELEVTGAEARATVVQRYMDAL